MNFAERLCDPRFQTEIIERNLREFGIEKLASEPTVVFDYTGIGEFWTTAMNSDSADLLVDRIRSGSLIPLNADALSQISSDRAAFYAYIAISGRGIPTIPTIINLEGKTGIVGKHQLPKIIPGVYVKKVSLTVEGESDTPTTQGFVLRQFSSPPEDGSQPPDKITYLTGVTSTPHNSAGISVIKADEANPDQLLPKTRWELLQPFVVPPDEFIRDIRTYLVGGRPVAGTIRRARQPLTDDNLSGKVLPTIEQYPSARAPGPNETLKGALRDLVYESASKIVTVLDAKIRSLSHRSYSPFSTFGFGSIDFLLDANSTPLPVDFDTTPSVTTFDETNLAVAAELAKHLAGLSVVGGLERKVMVIGFTGDPFADHVTRELRDLISPQRVVFQRSIIDKIIEEEARGGSANQ